MSIRAFLFLAALSSASAFAQTPKAYDPLEPPGRLIMCRRTTPPEDAPRGALQFVFHYGNASFDEHQTTVIFDSTGAPLALQVFAEENPETVYGFGIILANVDTTAQPDSTKGMKVITPRGLRPGHNAKAVQLTTAEVAAGRRLADYLWKLSMRASCATAPPSPGQ